MAIQSMHIKPRKHIRGWLGHKLATQVYVMNIMRSKCIRSHGKLVIASGCDSKPLHKRSVGKQAALLRDSGPAGRECVCIRPIFTERCSLCYYCWRMCEDNKQHLRQWSTHHNERIYSGSNSARARMDRNGLVRIYPIAIIRVVKVSDLLS